MTRAKPLSESKRPRRRSGELIRMFFGCPFCLRSGLNGGETLRVVAYRWRSVRVECDACGGRFSFDPFQLASATAKLGPDEQGRWPIEAGLAREVAGGFVAGHWRDEGLSPEQIRERLAEHGVPDSRDDD
jgi:hypothetical protein